MQIPFRTILVAISGLVIANALSPLIVIPNGDNQYSLLNSIDFHPHLHIVCVTFTHNNKVSLYTIDQNDPPVCIQTLSNPTARLREPQHAIFSLDAQKIVVANWSNSTLNIYLRKNNGLFSEKPATTIPFPSPLRRSKPHGIAFSPCGQYLAMACGAANYIEKGLALFRHQQNDLKWISYLRDNEVPGIPKGICFSPDGTHLLVTFSEPSALCIFSIENGEIQPTPKQTLQGADTGLSRPEDVKMSPDGTNCAVSNSTRDTVTFYAFDPKANRIIANCPLWTLANPEAQLSFPHGIAFSPDGTYLAITQFGRVQVTPEGDILWPSTLSPQEGTFNLYLLKQK
jgi:WD40 repeat protein